jgi:cyclopropane fatty-acyl-phospholipid synthase-like methyltransferase
VNTPQATEFFQVWDTYAKVVAGDYMFHRAIGDGVRAALSARFGDAPFTLLDLGCGDAATFAPLLEGLNVKSYRGADLSEAALALARQNLARLPCPVELVQSDFVSALGEAPPMDAIYTSYALHHLSTEGKADFFRLAAQRLTPGGLLLLVDVNRAEDERPEVHFRDYCAWLRRTMTALSDNEQDGLCDHILNNDFPERLSLLQAQAEAAGLHAQPGVRASKWHGLSVFAA